MKHAPLKRYNVPTKLLGGKSKKIVTLIRAVW